MCSQYSSFSCCSAQDVTGFNASLSAFANRFSNAACRQQIQDAACGFLCSAAQQHYVEVYSTNPVAAQYRVCSSYCDALYANCIDGTFNGTGAAVTFASSAALCAAMPVGPAGSTINVVSVPASSDRFNRTCFSGVETNQRQPTLLLGPYLGGGITYQNHSFIIEALDGFGQRVTTQDPIQVMVDGPNMFTPNVTYIGNGEYNVSYSPEIGGIYEVDVVIANSVPDLVPVFLGVTQASLCPLEGPRSAKPLGTLAPPPLCGNYRCDQCHRRRRCLVCMRLLTRARTLARIRAARRRRTTTTSSSVRASSTRCTTTPTASSSSTRCRVACTARPSRRCTTSPTTTRRARRRSRFARHSARIGACVRARMLGAMPVDVDRVVGTMRARTFSWRQVSCRRCTRARDCFAK
jgi:hypothetical protein